MQRSSSTKLQEYYTFIKHGNLDKILKPFSPASCEVSSHIIIDNSSTVWTLKLMNTTTIQKYNPRVKFEDHDPPSNYNYQHHWYFREQKHTKANPRFSQALRQLPWKSIIKFHIFLTTRSSNRNLQKIRITRAHLDICYFGRISTAASKYEGSSIKRLNKASHRERNPNLSRLLKMEYFDARIPTCFT